MLAEIVKFLVANSVKKVVDTGSFKCIFGLTFPEINLITRG